MISNIEKLFFIEKARDDAFKRKWKSVPSNSQSLPLTTRESDNDSMNLEIVAMKKVKIESDKDSMNSEIDKMEKVKIESTDAMDTD
jgi:uncharacterized protein YqhQ